MNETLVIQTFLWEPKKLPCFSFLNVSDTSENPSPLVSTPLDQSVGLEVRVCCVPSRSSMVINETWPAVITSNDG